MNNARFIRYFENVNLMTNSKTFCSGFEFDKQSSLGAIIADPISTNKPVRTNGAEVEEKSFSLN